MDSYGNFAHSLKIFFICLFGCMVLTYANFLLTANKKSDDEKINELNNTIERYEKNVHSLRNILGTQDMVYPYDLCQHLLNTNPIVYSTMYTTPNASYRVSINGRSKLELEPGKGYKYLGNLKPVRGESNWSSPVYEYLPDIDQLSDEQVMYYIIKVDNDEDENKNYILSFCVKFKLVI